MKKIIFLLMILSISIITTGCMSMIGMGGMHHNMPDQNKHNSGLSQKSVFQNEDLSLSLIVPPLYSGINSSIEFNIAYESKDYEKSTLRLILSIKETGNGSSQTIEFDTEGTFYVDYLPRSTGIAEISVRYTGETNEKLIVLQQEIASSSSADSFFSNPETYILGGLFMGSMMAVMFLTDWH